MYYNQYVICLLFTIYTYTDIYMCYNHLLINHILRSCILYLVTYLYYKLCTLYRAVNVLYTVYLLFCTVS